MIMFVINIKKKVNKKNNPIIKYLKKIKNQKKKL